ncbi:protein-disulfide reductase DsbD family protein [Gynurincola endophyticus]|uniref:protein-disulfide reductase DsbD family protein n=1 Tax=Gynurincola endophyticus TaxID=2479004 RepID=UPI000F8C7BBD|nr:thioredoxin family protein [Gynurincola endophyticus]
MKHQLKLLLSFLLLPFLFVQAQTTTPELKSSLNKINDSVAILTISADLPEGFKLFTINADNETELISSIHLSKELGAKLIEGFTEKGELKITTDDQLNQVIKYFESTVEYTAKVALDSSNEVEGSLVFLGKEGDGFPSGEVKFNVIADESFVEAAPSAESGSLWSFFLGGMAAGFGAFIMPCIYAMVPITVSFFTKRSTTRQQGIKNAIIYSLSIIGIFTAAGFLITLAFGPGALNALSSNAIFNILVFAMFLVFGFSFLGAFEITLPASWSSKMDSKANFNSYSGIFFMALTLVIVSFSCTVPFIGLLTVWTSRGGFLAPIIGFVGFSFALSLPFALFAFFPSMLNKMAKSGGWLNTVKVSLGFVELALALKFLSNADLAYHWRILDREVYLALWIVIFGLLGIYLLGKLKFHHDDELPKNDYGIPYLTVTRLMFAVGALSFAVYLIPGLWGAPLKSISAWLPQMKTQDFNLNNITVSSGTANANTVTYTPDIQPKKYTDILKSEIPGVVTFFDYDEAVIAAKQLKKPILIDFTGHACANCRKMEQEVLADKEVMTRLQNDFIVVSLYVDDKTRLPVEERYKSKSGQEVKTIGDKNLDFEIQTFGQSAQPLYVFVDENGKLLKDAGGYDASIQRFVNILEEVKEKYHKQN